MARRVSFAPLGNANLDNLLLDLRNTTVDRWPSHLKHACDIIANECERPDIAQSITLDVVAASHHCAVAINSTAMNIERHRTRNDLVSAATRIRNCLKRIKAPLRQLFDQAAESSFRDGVDRESFANFLHECTTIANRNKDDRDALRILAALGGTESHEVSKLINDLEALAPTDWLELEHSLSALKKNSEKMMAVRFFEELSRVDPLSEGARDKADPVLVYLKEVATCWRRRELHPAREYRSDKDAPYNQKYKSRFHRFAEFVLIARLDPGSRTFEPSDQDVARARNEERALPKSLREQLIPPGHVDLISDYQVRLALAIDSKKDA